MTVSSFPESLNGYITAHAVCYSYIKKRENIVKEKIYVHFLLDKQCVLLLNNERCHINKFFFFTVTVTVCCFFSLLRLYLTLWSRGICALLWRFCFGFSNELSCMWRGKCVWLEWQCRRDKSLFDGAAVRMSLFVWACWFSEGSGGKGYGRDSHPQCVCMCVCAWMLLGPLFLSSKSLPLTENTHAKQQDSIVLEAECYVEAKRRLEVGDKWDILERNVGEI